MTKAHYNAYHGVFKMIYVGTWGDKKGGRRLLEGAYYCKLMGTLIIFIKDVRRDA